MRPENTPLKNLHTVMSTRELEIFSKLITQYPDTFVQSELVIYLALAAIWIADILDQIQLSLDNIDVDTADKESLQMLSYLVGYEWNEALSVNVNRTRIKYYMYRKKYRGTIDSLKNLIKTGYAEEGFFSNRANNSIGIIENSPMIIVTITDNEDTVILRDNIEEVRPAGTVLRFLYRFTMDFIDFTMQETVAWTLAHIRAEMSYYDTDEIIEEWYSGIDQQVESIAGLPILDYNTSFRYLVDMSDYPELSYRPEEDKDPITTGDYDNLGLRVGKHDYFYKMYVKERDEYFNYIKPLKDAYTSIEMVTDGQSFTGFTKRSKTSDILAIYGNSDLTNDVTINFDSPYTPNFVNDVTINANTHSRNFKLANELKALLNTNDDNLKVYDIVDFPTRKFVKMIGSIVLNGTGFTENITTSSSNPDLSIFTLTPTDKSVDDSCKTDCICASNRLKGVVNSDNYLLRSEENISLYRDSSAMFVGAINTSRLVNGSLLELLKTKPITVYYPLDKYQIITIDQVDTKIEVDTSTTFTFKGTKDIIPSKAYIIANWDWSGMFK